LLRDNFILDKIIAGHPESKDRLAIMKNKQNRNLKQIYNKFKTNLKQI